MRRGRGPGCFLAAIVVLASARGSAQDSSAVAASQYDRGLADMLAGRYESGCPALAESHRIDPQPGALFTLAECEAAWGKIARAATHYQEYLDAFGGLSPAERSRQFGREKIAALKRAQLLPEIPELTLTLPASAPPGTTVTADGTALGSASLGVALPVDPGVHVLTTQAPGGPIHEQRLELARRDRRAVVLEVLASPAVPGAAPPSVAAPAAGPRGGDSLRTIAWVAGGVGVAGIAVGAVTGVVALSEAATVGDECQDLACSREGKAAADQGKPFATASTVGFAVGAVGVAVAIAVLLSHSSQPSSSAAARRVSSMLGGGLSF